MCCPWIDYESQCQNTLDGVNPVQYATLCFGQKLYIDQNEKPMVYNVLARKGFSGKIVSFVTIMAYGSTPYVGMTPKKNGGHIQSAQMTRSKCPR